MLFNSYIFILFFLPICVLGYFIVNKYFTKKRGREGLLWLSLMSFCFYGYAKAAYVFLLLLTIILNYLLSVWMRRVEKERIRKLLLSMGITFHVVTLFYFKYYDFFLDTIRDVIDLNRGIRLAVPLGISFITFSQISYLVDVYRSQEKEIPGFLEYMTYVVFFPKLTMGPILTQKDLIPQLLEEKRKRVSFENLGRGLYLFTSGLAKKVLIADTLAGIVSIGFSNVEGLNSLTALLVMLSYTLQLYFDFSGYCDMAAGVASMLNLEFALNFNSPYRAKSITEFWERWHITLTGFFTRYLYIPLGGSRNGRVRTYMNILIVFLISGLWHGDNWTFIIWGLLHGVCMVIERMYREFVTVKIQLPRYVEKIKGLVSWTVTFIIVNFAWVIFRAKSLEETETFFTRLFSGGWSIGREFIEYFQGLIEVRILARAGLKGLTSQYGGSMICISLLLLVLFCVYTKNVIEKSREMKFNKRTGIYLVVILLWCVVSLSNITEFLYFEF